MLIGPNASGKSNLLEPGQFISPHWLAVDSRGDIYVGEGSFTNWGNRYKGTPPLATTSLPGGPRQRTIEYVAPFDRCDRGRLPDRLGRVRGRGLRPFP